MRGYVLAVLLLAGAVPAVSDDLEDSLQKLKDAETKKDVALVKQLAAETCALARKEAATPAPDSEEGKQTWTKRMAYVKNVETYTEYALYNLAVQSQPATTIDLFGTLEEQNPKSKYLDEGYGRYFLALNQAGASAKILPLAEKGLKYFPDNEDILVLLADNAMNKNQPDRAAVYAERLVASLNKHSKPEGMSVADWERKKNTAMGRGRWIAGVVHANKTQYYEADKDLRVALPLVKGNETMLASTLFYLGVANYQLGAQLRDKARILEAAKFSDEAAQIKGPLSQQAWRNALAMRAEAAKYR